MRRTSSTVVFSAAMPPTSRVASSVSASSGEDEVKNTRPGEKGTEVTEDFLANEAVQPRLFELPRCSYRSSPMELVLADRRSGHVKTDGSSESGQLNNTDFPLSYSSRGLGSTTYTDDGDDFDAAEDDGNVGDDVTHEAAVTPRAARAKSSSGQRPTSSMATSATVTAMAAAMPPQTHADAAVFYRPCSSLASPPPSWSAMRKLRRASAPNTLTGLRNGTVSASSDELRGSDRCRLSSNSYNNNNNEVNSCRRPTSTVATSAGFVSSSFGAARPESTTLRLATREGESIQTSNRHRHCREGGYWTLAPRLRGVNEILLSTGDSRLFREAVEALHVWRTALQLDLHRNSAGGTYMVRLAATDPSSPAFESVGSPREVRCVFKPRDEEIGQDTNPHGNCESDRTEAFAPGSGSRREVLAYRLDHAHNAGVPPTIEVASNYAAGVPCRAASHGSEATAGARSGLLGDATITLAATPAGLSDLSTRTLGTVHGGADGAVRGGVHELHRAHHTADVDQNYHDNRSSGAVTIPQIGSLQMFIPGCQEAADVLPGRFDTDEVHALAIFDIRTLNGDRHGGNVLVQNYRSSSSSGRDRWNARSRSRGTSQKRSEPIPHLVPIDHSYICPSGYADPDYEWLSWPQTKKPFSPSNLRYIAALDAVADAELVRSALLAHSNAVPYGNNGGADPFDVSAYTLVRADGDVDPAWATSFMRRSECTSAQERGVAHDAYFCRPNASCPAMSPLQGLCCDSFNELTIYSPVRRPNHGGNGNSHCAAAAAAADDFDAKQGFSPTALPGHRDDDAGAWDQWEIATTQLLDVCDGVAHPRDDGRAAEEDDAGAHWGTKRSSCPMRTPPMSTSPTISFPAYGGGVVEAHQTEAVNAVTYDSGAADAAAEVVRCTTRLLQIAALEFHMTAYEIGSLCRRPRVAQASFLEEVMEEARDEFSWEVAPPSFDLLVRQRLAAAGSDAAAAAALTERQTCGA
ncbi:hypothetical protein ABB37_02283 [Leptomonas pyrrhocoris]|uniref:PI3K/PI4K catalytic domain-containing protein n=1 Tax=Leptomonas pyrrhocoris TaxID=157538 RepID=A0A0M9G7W5_LEPPY|nr:hypothetical protein ABB37_02283 [Leptomonas pyrrhocoris]KPA84239.1 hypothetical protein ABB37_02283 [Leptomonas pyrrhocoris]|eukprot:XP_015662678.1 hypothetical protein ABB37_02283 [Leptomonas pyrrhocoris]